MEPPHAGNLAVRAHAGVTRRAQRGLEPVKVVDQQGGVRLAGRGERLLDAYVELVAAAEREPGASSGAQRLRLLELLQAEQVAEEAPRFGLAARQCGELDVI